MGESSQKFHRMPVVSVPAQADSWTEVDDVYYLRDNLNDGGGSKKEKRSLNLKT